MSAQLRAFSFPRISVRPSTPLPIPPPVESGKGRLVADYRPAASARSTAGDGSSSRESGVREVPGSTLGTLDDVDAGVVMVQDLLVGFAAQCHAVGPDLAQADAVTPALAAEDERRDLAVRGQGSIHGE